MIQKYSKPCIVIAGFTELKYNLTVNIFLHILFLNGHTFLAYGQMHSYRQNIYLIFYEQKLYILTFAI
jgi:hypothetical protein